MKHSSPFRFVARGRICAALAVTLALGFAASACSAPMPERAVPLASLELDLALAGERMDEGERTQLPLGCYAGLAFADARASLDALTRPPEGLLVASVGENSPAQAAGLRVGDVLLEARAPTDAAPRALGWPSEWRALELELAPGTRVELLVDRGGQELALALELEARLAPTERMQPVSAREELRVGVLLRTPTEVEARAAGLAPGAGALVIGLARESAWRAAGVRHGDLIARVGGAPLADPRALVETIGAAPRGARLALELWREPSAGAARQRIELEAPLGQRAQELARLSAWPLFSWSKVRGRESFSVLFGLYASESTEAATRRTFLWLIELESGAADRLKDESRS